MHVAAARISIRRATQSRQEESAWRFIKLSCRASNENVRGTSLYTLVRAISPFYCEFTTRFLLRTKKKERKYPIFLRLEVQWKSVPRCKYSLVIPVNDP